MKKIILLLTFLLYSVLGFSQVETFEGGIPTNWAVINGTNGVGALQPWILNTTPFPVNPSPYPAHNDTTPPTQNAAYVNNEQIGMGNTEEDWLIMNQRLIPTNGQLRFWTRLTTVGDQGTIYQIRVSTGANQTSQGGYTILQTWGEDEIIDPTQPLADYQEVTVDFPAALQGQNVYIAFVRVFTQPLGARAGDRWLIDDVNIVQKCLAPTNPGIVPASIASTSVTLTWQNPGLSTDFEVEVIPASQDPTGVGTPINVSPAVANVNVPCPIVLLPGTTYKYYVRAVCGPGNTSEWAGPAIFPTLVLGSVCADPLAISALPFQDTGNTATYGDEVDTPQGNSCGALPVGTNYLSGNEVFYQYTPTENGVISVTMTPLGTTSTNSSVFVYQDCNIGTCLGGSASANTNVRSFNLNVTAGVHYTIVISSGPATQSITYNLLIQKEDCTPKPTGLAANGITINSADLTWTSPATFSSWEVAVQPLGSLVPSGAGVPVATNSYTPTLTSGTQYQFWVRAECGTGSGVFSAWAGPFPFNTLICNPADKCDYTFRLANTTANGWGATRMQVRQNGIVVADLGATAAGTGPTDVTVALCNNVPFDLFWNVAGTAPQQRIVTIINKFGQTIYTKPAGTGAVNTVLYNDVVNCDIPRCDIAPINVTISDVTTTGGTIHWVAPATTSWDVYVVPQGSPAPTATTTPTYDDVTGTSPATFVTTLPLLPDHCYDVYVRVNCSPDPSLWSAPGTFCTNPTCFKPTNPVVAGPTTLTGTTFTWDPGNASNTQFEILIVAGPNPPSPLPDNGTVSNYPIITVPAGGPYTFTVDNLLPATIYYAYVRSVCSPTDSSVWTPFPVFNTVTCADSDKCNYKFILTSAVGNNWNNGRIQVRQNGIVVATLGATGVNAAAGITVPICNGVPFDLYWSAAGTTPQNIGVSVQNPFLDVLYTKAPGTGTPLTVLYASTGNCVPAACSKPINMVVTSVDATSATITWDDISVPTAPNYDIYIVETIGGVAPTNDPASPASIENIHSPFTINAANGFALNPSTSYTFYLKSICSDTESSTWTVLTPIIFVTTPVNNKCVNAINVPINTGQTCTLPPVPGNTYGANSDLTDPPGGTPASGCGSTDDDIWFTFTAGATSQTINFSNIVGTPASAKINHSVFSGSCGSLTQMYCSTNASSTATGLTVGQTYYIRVYTSGTNLAQFVKFNLCITSPPANDECANALNVQVNPLWECNPALNTAGSTLGATTSTPAVTGTGCGTTDDDVWFSFTATNNIHIIDINDIVGTSTAVALNHSLFSGPCDALVKLYCSTATESVATGLTPGQVYHIRVYTAANTAGQSATFNVCVSTPPPPATNDDCSAAINAVVNATSKCTLTTAGNIIGATASSQPSSCIGAEDDDVWFTFTALSTQHIISLLNLEGTTSNLNHAVYTGNCGGLTLKYCSAANSLTSTATNFVVGQTYYIRVWSNENTSQVVIFDLCIKSVSTCENAEPFCGSSVDNPYIYENTTGIPNASQIACLGSIPNPTYYTLHVGQTGDLAFNILQNTSFDAAGNPVGTNLDVDFVAWGPFDSPDSCNEISFTDCPTCPNNTNDPTFYPFGNIVDCSYDGSFTETLTIPGAVSGQFYIILVTNFNGAAGLIRLVQTNFGDADAGETVCCDVDLGPDKSLCAESVELNALAGIQDLDNVPSTFQWFLNGSTTPIVDQDGVIVTSATITVTQSGTYTVKGSCGLNPVEDDIVVVLGPVILTTPPDDYEVCDVAPNDGLAEFDLTTLTPQVLGSLNSADYVVTYYVDEGEANADAANTIDTTVLFPNTVPYLQTIYIRVESTALATCYSVVPVNLVVTPKADASFAYSPTQYCSDVETITPSSVVDAGVFTATGGLTINAATGVITLNGNEDGVYTITNTVAGDCGDTKTASITINRTPDFNVSGDMEICPLATTTITVDAVAGSFNPAAVSYQWFFGANEIIGQAGQSLVINLSSPDYDYGMYSVTVNNAGCTTTKQFEITEAVNNYAVSFENTPYTICQNQSVTLSFVGTNFDINDPTAV
ncbi:MAG: hypothetical protein CFE23_16135, partial [Flavobacterium sp. BFFFF1]|uniref:fibronectin type III domain-containing protein n=1 Tax=Flavobacterium sp. BFFFF1 TaxID=2015557 RepID=UPI000BCB071D